MKQVNYQWVIGKLKGFLPFYLFILLPLCASAQDDSKMREIYVQAEDDYQIGRFEQAHDSLLVHLNSFRGNERQNALRLIALSYLARYDIQQTEHYATMLLQQNPYYTVTAQDPPTFADIVAHIKAGMTAIITTASSQAESLAEVPVPTTLITAEMIRKSGARNLQEVLAAYVPGMHLIDSNDDINIAMRGIYSNTQEKILIMLNGHRLNSYATNTAAPDFSISLEKVKQIEVLRGPASSLYGDVALTGVVNIITKQGADVDGIQAKVSGGNFGQLRADAIIGKRYFDIDLLVWGSVYRNSGEQYDSVRIGRIGKYPSYDIGLQLGYKGLQLLYNSHFSQVVAPFTMNTLALPYDHERYCTHNGYKPSFATSSQHADLSYQWSMFNVQWKAAATYDKSDLTRYQVLGDEPSPVLTISLPLPQSMISTFNNNEGLSRYVNGQEQDYSFQLKGNYAYTLGRNQKGHISFGAEYGHFQLDDIRYLMGYNFVETFPEDDQIREMGKGSEHRANAYLQLKHQWDFSLFTYHTSLLLNAGMRFDYKNRYDDTKVHELSPRVALILLRPKWNIRLSYSKSFVDAPYVYRKTNVLAALVGERKDAVSLSPERAYSLQLSFAGQNWVKGLNFEVNGFYNRTDDLIMTDVLGYRNASQNKTGGMELMASYKQPKFSADWNITWTHTFRSNLISFDLPETLVPYYLNDIDGNNNTPAIASNLVLGWQATRQLMLHAHVLFESRQTSYNNDLELYAQTQTKYLLYDFYRLVPGMEEGLAAAWEAAVASTRQIISHDEMPARCILNIGGEYQLGPVTLGLDIHNLLGTRYYRSGWNTRLIPQQGRWFLVTLGIKI